MKLLNLITEAAYRAPTGSNMQEVGFTLVTDPNNIKQVIKLAMEIFSGLVDLIKDQSDKPEIAQTIGYLTHLLEEYKKGNDPILRNATALLLIHTPKEARFGYADANLAYQNGSLMAESLGVNQFFTGFLCTAIKEDHSGKINEFLGINGVVHAGMALALPSFQFVNYIDREDIKLKKL